MKLKTLLLCCSLMFLTSCVTGYLWGDKNYDENIYQVFIGEDGRYLVLVSNEYHYVFADNSGIMRQVLSLQQDGVITVNSYKSFLKLSDNNDVNGELVMEGPFDLLPREDAIKLHTLGLSPNNKNNVSIKVKLSGRRYAARYLGNSFGKAPLGLNKLRIYYRGDSGLIKDVSKAAITPVAVTLDAVLLIGKVTIYEPYKFFNKDRQ